MRELRQQKFINDHLPRIVKMGIENEGKIGYVQLTADNDFQLLNNKIEFIEGKFSKKNFLMAKEPKPYDPEKVAKVFNIYYRVLWFDDKTVWQVKEVIILERLEY